MNKQYYVYIATNKINTVFYIGVTNNLVRRIFEHKNKLISGFTAKYNINKLVYLEVYENISSAIEREKQLKGGSRSNKIALIRKTNLLYKDLYDKII
jgi:putative endonuclease